MRIAVIGARGFIGRRLVQRLAERGYDVLTMSSQDHDRWSHDGLIRVPDDLGPVDSVYYLAQSPRWKPPSVDVSHIWAVNVQSALVAAHWAQRQGAERFVYASTGNVYAPSFRRLKEDEPLGPDSEYALSKVHAEQALARLARDVSDLDVTSVRLFGVYGASQEARLFPRLVEAISHGRPVTLARAVHEVGGTNGLQLSMCHVDDVADVLIDLNALRDCPTINLAGPEAVSIRYLAEVIGSVLGMTPRFDASDARRLGDLLADTELLGNLVNHVFTPLVDGVRQALVSDEAPSNQSS